MRRKWKWLRFSIGQSGKASLKRGSETEKWMKWGNEPWENLRWEFQTAGTACTKTLSREPAWCARRTAKVWRWLGQKEEESLRRWSKGGLSHRPTGGLWILLYMWWKLLEGLSRWICDLIVLKDHSGYYSSVVWWDKAKKSNCGRGKKSEFYLGQCIGSHTLCIFPIFHHCLFHLCQVSLHFRTWVKFHIKGHGTHLSK